MPDYKKMYFRLFNAATDAIRLIEAGELFSAKERLIFAQQETEEMYISAEDEEE